MASKAATKLTYTEKELEAISILEAHRGEKLSAKVLGISTGTLTSLAKKAVKEFSEASDVQPVVINKEDFEEVCPHCGHVTKCKLYWID